MTETVGCVGVIPRDSKRLSYSRMRTQLIMRLIAKGLVNT